MPIPKSAKPWPLNRLALLELGKQRIAEFAEANGVTLPETTRIPRVEWHFDACAYYRPDGIKICVEHCGAPCGEEMSRNWTWPANTTDREPYGVICHEMGHHLDWLKSEKKSSYGGDYSISLRKQSGEAAISGYCPNDWEWFAEMMRVFITNHGLLRSLRPKTHALLAEQWEPVGTSSWKLALGSNVPDRVVRALINKGAK